MSTTSRSSGPRRANGWRSTWSASRCGRWSGATCWRRPRPGWRRPTSSTPLSPAALELEERLRDAGFEPPIEADLGEAARELPALRAAGRAVRVGRQLHFHADALGEIERRVVSHLEEHGTLTLAELRDSLN